MIAQFTLISKILVFLINVTGLSLIISVCISKTRNILRVMFALMTFLMFIWVDFAFLARLSEQSDTALFYIRIAWSITPLLFILIYYFIVSFLKTETKFKNLTFVLYFLGFLFLIVTFFTDLIIADISFEKGILSILYGPLVWFFFGIVAVLTAINFYILFNHYKNKSIDEEIKLRIRYLLYGLAFFFLMNGIFNIILPVFFHVVHLYEFGDYSTIIFLAIIAYAIVRRKFFGVRVVLTTFVVSFLSSFLLLDFFIFSETFEQKIASLFIFVLFIPFGVLLVRSILTEIKQKEQLEDLAQQQKDIIDVMGHEIRTPLTAIVQELNLHKKVTIPKKEDFISGKVKEDDLKSTLQMIFESLDTIDKASTHAVSLVNDMLETARLDKKTFELEYSKFDLGKLVEDAIEVMRKTVTEDEDVAISFEQNLGGLEVEADKTRINEAVLALLSNAIKYGGNPETKNIRIKVQAERENGYAKVTIMDNGIGIAQEDIQKLGKKFLRLHSKSGNHLKRPGGTGLGLFVVKGIMEYHNGELIIESDGIGKGSSFTLRFPASQ